MSAWADTWVGPYVRRDTDMETALEHRSLLATGDGRPSPQGTITGVSVAVPPTPLRRVKPAVKLGPFNA